MRLTIFQLAIAIIAVTFVLVTFLIAINSKRECEEYRVMESFERTVHGYIIYYVDDVVEEVYCLPRCVKLKSK